MSIIYQHIKKEFKIHSESSNYFSAFISKSGITYIELKSFCIAKRKIVEIPSLFLLTLPV